MFHNCRINQLLKSDKRFGRGGYARGGFVVSVLFLFLLGFVSEAEPQGFVPQNPMEKQFNVPQAAVQATVQAEAVSQFAKRSQFIDDTISQPIVPQRAAEKPKIRQVSTAPATTQPATPSADGSASASVWDNLRGTTGNEMTLADWGVGSPAMAPSNQTPPSAYPNTVNPYSNTESQSIASPANNPYTALYAQGMNFGNFSYGGYGYYDPNTGQVFANQYNPYSGYSDPSAAYSAYGGDTSGYFGNGQQGMYNPYNAYNSYNPYGAAADNTGGDIAGQQQTSLYQALLLQELMLRQREDEAAEKAGRKESQGSDKKKKDGDDNTPESQWTMKQLMPLQVSSPLGETMLSGAKMLSPFCTPEGPNRGVGQPLLNRSWLDHPYYFGGFCGWISGSQLVSGLIDQKSGGTGGLILGYNLNEYWGVEGRVHFASIDIRETAKGVAEYNKAYLAKFEDATLASIPSLTTRTNQLSVADVAVHYYPLGNAKWKPFFKYGLGLGRESFVDTYGIKHRENTVTMPLGIGLRYWWNENLAIQADLIDNVVFSSGITKTQSNFAFGVGLTYAFGSNKKKRPTAYWPYTPSMGSKW